MKAAKCLVLVLFASSCAAQACSVLRPTNLSKVRWKYCSEINRVMIENNSPYTIQIDFTVNYMAGGIPGTWEYDIASGKYATVPSKGAVVNVRVTGLKILSS
jgi:hypothetical protein